MPNPNPKITTCLWFDGQAAEAAAHYTSTFPNSYITEKTYYEGPEGGGHHGFERGSVKTVSFTLNGNAFTAINGGPIYTFSEATSFQIDCDNQDEVDYYFGKLCGGEDKVMECGWCKDKWGVTWQILPKQLFKYMREGNAEQTGRIMAAMMKKEKIDVEALKKAFEGAE
ncbi:3-demethylubiquinone-9 3-O-methyltransferase [Sporormia fimetaria CBS 119925]|uniref:3-demethylubiquinone-9 3-O-methyltransferase n=1 Tax=Sporormia fimetaria CBS 119925 TaxID=1340428 RepID=A0A6A6VDC3_9PLEO|nr:3-demethylubiquinone-9 3-O-methyltransferase [Sporormia fimetaria CBS 119925]